MSQKEFERGNRVCDEILGKVGPVDWSAIVEPANQDFFTSHKNYLQVRPATSSPAHGLTHEQMCCGSCQWDASCCCMMGLMWVRAGRRLGSAFLAGQLMLRSFMCTALQTSRAAEKG